MKEVGSAYVGAEKVIDSIYNQETPELFKYLNTEILQRFEEKSLDYHPFTYSKICKALVVGSCSTFHEFIQALVLSINQSPQLKIFNYIRVYVVSNSGDINPLATYLSRKDPVYQRLIYVPSVVLPIYPLDSDKSFIEFQNRVRRNIDVFGPYFSKELNSRLLPYELLENNLQTYLTESSHFIKVYLYEVNGLKLDGTSIKLYMFHNLELSKEIEHKVKATQPMLKVSDRRIDPLELEVSADIIDENEQIYPSKMKIQRTVNRLSLCNFEPSQKTLMADLSPSEKGLSLTLLDEEGASILMNNQKKVKKGYTVPVRALHNTHKIYRAVFRQINPQAQFHATVDNNFYGPFTRLEVSPLFILPNKHLYLPVMTFNSISELS